MIKLTFVNSGELCKFEIDRENKICRLASSKTDYKMTEISYNMLFDSIQEKEDAETLTDEQFEKAITINMQLNGYKKCQ